MNRHERERRAAVSRWEPMVHALLAAMAGPIALCVTALLAWWAL